jgi:ubiquinone/menaquinone biosynthesis C-methylase UbiE
MEKTDNRLQLCVSMFDRWAPTYDDCTLRPLYQIAHHAVLDAVVRLGLRPRRVLDVGCGTGHLLAAAARRLPHTVLLGIDPAAAMIFIAHDRRPRTNVHFGQAVVERLPFRANSFDLVTSTTSFRHWTHPPAAMQEIGRILAHRGVLLLADAFAPRRRSWLGRVPGSTTIPSLLSRKALRSLGFDLLAVDYVGGFGPVSEVALVAARRMH